MMKFKLLFLIFFLFVSCQKNNTDNDTYEVISVVYNKLAKPVPLMNSYDYYRFINKKLTRKDSMHIDSINRIVKEERLKHRFITAIYPNFNLDYDLKNLSLQAECTSFKNEFEKFKNVTLKEEKQKQIDISRITRIRSDSIIYFQKDLIQKGQKDFKGFDVLLTFSPVIFNQDHTKAMVLCSFNRSTLAGYSGFYFLKKRDNKWVIVCEQGLSIS